MLVAQLQRLHAALLRPAAGLLASQVRDRKSMTMIKPAWKGWPRLSPDGWPYARWLKLKERNAYLTKQAKRRAQGRQKGARAARAAATTTACRAAAAARAAARALPSCLEPTRADRSRVPAGKMGRDLYAATFEGVPEYTAEAAAGEATPISRIIGRRI
jgi:hypothetical protein